MTPERELDKCLSILNDLFKYKKVGLILSGGNVDLDDLPW